MLAPFSLNSSATNEDDEPADDLADLGLEIDDRSRAPGTRRGNTPITYTVMLTNIPPRLYDVEQLLAVLRHPNWRNPLGPWQQMAARDWRPPTIRLGYVTSPTTSSRTRAAWIAFEHEHLAAALLRASGSLRAAGGGGGRLYVSLARSNAQTTTPGQCYKCYGTGHFARECVAPAACRRCHQPGHLAATCSNNPVGGSSLKCYRCGDGAHTTSMCHWSDLVILANSTTRTGHGSLYSYNTVTPPTAPQPTLPSTSGTGGGPPPGGPSPGHTERPVEQVTLTPVNAWSNGPPQVPPSKADQLEARLTRLEENLGRALQIQSDTRHELLTVVQTQLSEGFATMMSQMVLALGNQPLNAQRPALGALTESPTPVATQPRILPLHTVTPPTSAITIAGASLPAQDTPPTQQLARQTPQASANNQIELLLAQLQTPQPRHTDGPPQ